MEGSHEAFEGCVPETALTVKVDKFQFGMVQCLYLGHKVGNGIVRPENSKLEDLKDFPIPRTKTWFYEENRMLYRHWQPLVEGEGLAIEQLVLPVVVRRTVMMVAHEIQLAGHMGKKRTVQRVLQQFYWPSVYRDVAEWCKCCAICRKCSKGKKGYAPLMPLPIIHLEGSRWSLLDLFRGAGQETSMF